MPTSAVGLVVLRFSVHAFLTASLTIQTHIVVPRGLSLAAVVPIMVRKSRAAARSKVEDGLNCKSILANICSARDLPHHPGISLQLCRKPLPAN
jgi:hypothetical protein